MLKAITAHVLRDVAAEDALPLTLSAGDRIRIVDPPQPRAGYLWGDDGSFCSGWIPESIVERLGDQVALSIDYCSAHLNVSAGNELRVLWKGQGFDAVWCENRDGDRGWVPADALSIPPDQGVEQDDE